MKRRTLYGIVLGVIIGIAVGIALITGGWNAFLIWLLSTFNFDAGTLL